MKTDRRSFVKMLSYGALSCAVSGSLTDSLLAECTPSSMVCILLHGLFFMGFKGNNLIVATPQFKPHHFGIREQGGAIIVPIPGQDLNWTAVGLVDNIASTKTFPLNVPQFSAKDTGVGEFMPAGTSTHQFQLILPRPQVIHGFRQDLLIDFEQCTESKHPKPAGLKPMQENIISSCGGSRTGHFALLTGLIFNKTSMWTRKNVVSFYAEHLNSCNLKKDDVNAALNEGKKLFAAGIQNFDLAYKDPDNPLLSICPPECDFFGVTKNDQLSIEELSSNPPDCCQTRGPNPINCAQYGVNA